MKQLLLYGHYFFELGDLLQFLPDGGEDVVEELLHPVDEEQSAADELEDEGLEGGEDRAHFLLGLLQHLPDDAASDALLVSHGQRAVEVDYVVYV